MPLTISLSTQPSLLGTAENAGDQIVNQKKLNNEFRVALVAVAAKTPIDVSSGLFVVTQAGKNGAGALTLTGVKVGDKVVGVANITTPGDLRSSYEVTITVADQIQQSSAVNLSAAQVQFMIVRQS